MTAVAHMSHSRFQQYSSCGEAYRLERIEEVPTTPSIYAIAGTAFHVWSENLDWLTMDPTAGQIGDAAEDFVDRVAKAEESSGFALRQWDNPSHKPDANATQFEKLRDELIPEWCEKYHAWRTTGPAAQWEIATGLPAGDENAITTGIEWLVEVQLPDGGPLIVAYLDRVFRLPDGRLVIVDLKTWSKRRTEAQLPTYVVLARAAGVDVAGACYYEARKGEATEIKDYRYWDLPRLTAMHAQAAEMIDRGYFLPRPNEDCLSFCSVRRHCAFAL